MPLDLTNCDKEKLHLITEIQGHGTILVMNEVDLKITHVGENLARFFGHSEDGAFFIGKRLVDVLSFDLATRIFQLIKSRTFTSGLEYVSENGETVEVHIFPLSNELMGIEFERFDPEIGHREKKELNPYIEQMQTGRSLEEVSEVACKAVRSLTGFERVMIYRFFPPEMFGEVIAEDRVANAQSFLRHRFPATDIPKPARELYLKNKVRYIHDSESADVPILTGAGNKNTVLDMTDSRLRAVSKVHVEYLRNMKVRGSMSVAIISGGSLWGIISCHHSSPLYVSQASRRLCLQVGNTLGMVAPLMENAARMKAEIRFNSELHKLFSEISTEKEPLNGVFKKIDQLNSLFSSHGVAYVTPEKIVSAGITPLTADVRKLWEVLRKKMNSDVFDTRRISELSLEFLSFKDQASGILAIKVSPLDDSMMIFLRPESLQTIRWGGDPRKNLEQREYNGQINPRASFETWTEVVNGASLPWTDFEIKGARHFRNLVFDSLVRKEQLIDELHTRLRSKG